MKLRSGLSGLLLALLAVTTTACSAGLPEQTEANQAEASETAEMLENANAITLKKDMVSIGDHWSIKVDGEEVATIEGLDLKALGDTYSLLSPSGGFIAGEDEDIMSIARTAHFYDSEQNVTGTLKKELLSFGAKYELRDGADELTARFEQKFSLSFKGMIEDGEGAGVWEMKRKMMAMSPDLTLTRQGDSRAVSALDAIRIAVVASEIYDAENES